MTKFERKFVLMHVFNSISEMKEKELKYSETEMHFGIPWRICVRKQADHLAAFLYCEPDEKGAWSVETESSLEIVSPLGKKTEHRITNPFKKDTTDWGTSKLVSWTEMEKNYVENDQILMRCHVTVKKITGIPKKRLRDFDESMGDLSDVVLKVGDEKFHVSKMVLASHSTFFKSIFFGKFDEAKKSEIELKEIDPKEFQDFLEMLYGESAVNDSNVDGILKLAEMYDTPIVTRKCEEYLVITPDVSDKKKIRLSSQFQLNNLLQSCLEQQKTVQEVRSLVPLDLKCLNSHVTREILRRVLELTPPQQ